MSKEMLDVLVDKKKVEEIAALSTKEDVEKKLKAEGVNVTAKDVTALGNVFEAAANKLGENELEKIGGGIDWKGEKAKKAYKIIGGVVGAGAVLGAGYVAHKKGWFSSKKLVSAPPATSPVSEKGNLPVDTQTNVLDKPADGE